MILRLYTVYKEELSTVTNYNISKFHITMCDQSMSDLSYCEVTYYRPNYIACHWGVWIKLEKRVP